MLLDYQLNKDIKRETEEIITCFFFTLYVYMTMLPSASFYVAPRQFVLTIVLFLFLHLAITRHYQMTIALKFAFLFICANVLSLISNDQFISQDIAYMLHVTTICIFITFPLGLQKKIYYLFIRIGAVLLFFGLIEYILYVYFHKSIFLIANIDRGEGSMQVYDHGLFNIFTNDIIIRFQGLFREPGFLGICAGLIAFNWENINKKDFVIWMIGGLFSLSLTFYIMLVLSVVYHIFFYNGTIKAKIAVVGFFILLFGILASQETIKDAIWTRIESYSSGKDNRTTEELNDALPKLFNSSDIFFGYGYKHFVNRGFIWGNAGLKAELYKYGLILVVIFILGFCLLVASYQISNNRKYFVIILYLISFYCVDCKYACHIYILLLPLLNIYVNKSFAYNRSSIIK